MEDTSAIESALLNIKPLRDLAQNWDIDLASCLEEYLSELAQVGHPVPHSIVPSSILSDDSSGSAHKTNFAQAALLLQNSSFVYSRKVEYLYSLVFSALNELLASTANGKGGTLRKTSKSADKDLEEFETFDPQLLFLLLDDVLPIDEAGDKIDMRRGDTYNMEDSYSTDILNKSELKSVSRTANNTASRHGDRSFVDIVIGAGRPSSFSGPAAIFHSTQGRAVLDALSQANMATTATQDVATGGTLRLPYGACDMDDETGAILIPGSNTLAYSNSGNTLQSRLAHAALDMDSTNTNATNTNVTFKDTLEPQDTDEFGFDAFHDDHDDFDDHHHHNHIDGTDSQDLQQSKERIQQPTSSIDPSSQRILRNRNVPNDKGVPITNDPWLLLDPHDPGALKPCPIRIGSTYKLPPDVEGLPSDSVTGSRTKSSASSKRKDKTKSGNKVDDSETSKAKQVVDFVSTATFDSILSFYDTWMQNTMENQNPKDSDSSDCNNTIIQDYQNYPFFTIPKTGLIFGDEFAYIAQAGKKRLKEQKRQARKERIEQGVNSTMPPEKINQHLCDLYDDGEDNGSDHDFGGGFAMGDDNDDQDMSIARGATTADPSNVNISLHQFNSVFGSNETVSSESKQDEILSFDELCRAHLMEFAKGAERYAVETQLSKRVSIWQDRLATVLDEEEQRPEFNIHSYGKNILHKVQVQSDNNDTSESKTSQVVNFSSIVTTNEKYEVCRLFLATLMLCNSENVTLVNQAGAPGSIAQPDSLKLILLNSDLQSPMDGYLAPSAAIFDSGEESYKGGK